MSEDRKTGETHGNGAEPVYGPAASRMGQDHDSSTANRRSRTVLDDAAPPYTAPYPPYPSDVPYTTPIPVNMAAALAYLLAPAVVFLLLPAYRSQSLVRFHSWQAIFYFIASVALREIAQLLVSLVPSAIAFTANGLLLLLLFAGWLVAVLKALQGEKWLLPGVGRYAERTASTTSLRE